MGGQAFWVDDVPRLEDAAQPRLIDQASKVAALANPAVLPAACVAAIGAARCLFSSNLLGYTDTPVAVR